MNPDLLSIQLRRWMVRALAVSLAGLILVAIAVAGRSDADPPDTDPPDTVAKLYGESPQPAEPAPSPPVTATIVPPETPAPSEEPAGEPARSAAGPIQQPFSVQIPRIGVNAPVIAIQVGADRVLMPPRELSVVGWWSEGAAPGGTAGSAVLVGHSSRAGGGVFDQVGDLRRGDVIEVSGSNGTLSYQLESIEVLSKEDVARNAEQIFDQSVAGRLVVITCEDFDGTTWRSNIVAIATPA
jgi:LPXTG-site transpeptidase (sortase) family protein